MLSGPWVPERGEGRGTNCGDLCAVEQGQRLNISDFPVHFLPVSKIL